MSKCTKSAMSAADADKALGRIPQKPSGTVPVRKYYCRAHRAWHITSKPERKR